jgi:nucleotide-binding universal stress UspA family protein
MTPPVLDEAPAAVELIAAGQNPSRDGPPPPDTSARPIIVAVDGSPGALAAAESGARLARQTAAPLVLVYVRERPRGWIGEPYHQRRLDAEMAIGEAALARARAAAERHGADISTEILEGAPARRIREFAEARDARTVVVGTRRRRLTRSVSQKIIRDSKRPVLVAAA